MSACSTPSHFHTFLPLSPSFSSRGLGPVSQPEDYSWEVNVHRHSVAHSVAVVGADESRPPLTRHALSRLAYGAHTQIQWWEKSLSLTSPKPSPPPRRGRGGRRPSQRSSVENPYFATPLTFRRTPPRARLTHAHARKAILRLKTTTRDERRDGKASACARPKGSWTDANGRACCVSARPH